MKPELSTPACVPLRDPATVMRLERLGSFHQSRLSFMRILTRRMTRENWTFSRPEFEIDAKGVGHAVYCAHTLTGTYALVAFAHDLPADKRSDRVIAEGNQGGDLVEEVLRQVDAMLPVTKVRATSGKTARAEPVAAMYEQGKVHHTKRLGALEDQMCKMNLQGYQGAGSPDRVDALVWALHGLMIAPSTAPKMRIL